MYRTYANQRCGAYLRAVLNTIVIPLSTVFTPSNYCNWQLKSLLHLGQIVITFRTLLHLGQNVITFGLYYIQSRLLHLGLLQHLLLTQGNLLAQVRGRWAVSQKPKLIRILHYTVSALFRSFKKILLCCNDIAGQQTLSFSRRWSRNTTFLESVMRQNMSCSRINVVAEISKLSILSRNHAKLDIAI